MRLLLLPALLLGLAACASPGRELPPPPPPTAFDAPLEPVEEWRASVGRTPATDSYRLAPALMGGRLYVAAAGGRVSAFDAETGERLWRSDLDYTLSGGPGAGAEVIAVGSREGRVIGLDPRDGRVLWESGVTSEVMSVPAVATGVVVVRSGDGRVFGLDARNGRRLWLHDRTPPVLTLRGTGSPVIVGSLALVGLDGGRVVALNLRDGRVAWEAEVAAPRGRTELERMVDIDGDPVVMGNEVYAASYQGRLVGIGLHNGRVAWGREFSSHIGVGVDGERVYAVDSDYRVWAFDRFSGAAIWRQEDLQGVRLTAPVVYRDYLLVGDSDGYLNWLSVRDGELLDRTRVGRGEIRAAPLVAEGRIHALTSNGELRVYQLPRDE